MTVLANQLSRGLQQPCAYFLLACVHRAMDSQSGGVHASILTPEGAVILMLIQLYHYL